MATLGLLLNVVFPVAFIRYAATEEASCFLALSTNLSMLRKHARTILPTLIVIALAPYAFSLVTTPLMFLIFPIFLSSFFLFYTGLFTAHMLGRLSAKLDLGYNASVDTDFWG